jgi:hypothetical protein
MKVIFNKSSWKHQNEAEKVSKSKIKNTIQTKLEITSYPESFRMPREDEWCRKLPE